MAITKFMTLHEDKHSSEKGARIKRLLDYVSNTNKTENGENVGYINVPQSTDGAYKSMILTKKFYQKVDNRQAYHFVISAMPFEGDTKSMMDLAKEFCERYFDNRYEIVYAVHNNSEKVHAHIVFNSVSYMDGYKYHMPDGEWINIIQPLVNEIGMKYGYKELELDEFIKEKKQEYVPEGGWRKKIKNDIDEAVDNSKSFEEFIEYLKTKKSYKINFGKYMTLKPFGKQRYARCTIKGLGELYTEEAIKERIELVGRPMPIIEGLVRDSNTNINVKKISIKYAKYKDMTPYQKYYFRRKLKYGTINKNKVRKLIDYNGVREANYAMKQYNYLNDNDINSADKLHEKYSKVCQKKDEILLQKNKLIYERKLYKKYIDIVNEIKRKGIDSPDLFELYEKIKKSGHTVKDIVDYEENYKIRYYQIRREEKEIINEKKLIENIFRSDDIHSLTVDNKSLFTGNTRFEIMYKNYEERVKSFNEALNRITKNNYENEEYYYCKCKKPNDYIKISSIWSEKDNRTYSSYYVYVDGNLVNDKPYSDRDGKWFDTRKKIMQAGDFGDELLYFSNSEGLNTYIDSYVEYTNSQNKEVSKKIEESEQQISIKNQKK